MTQLPELITEAGAERYQTQMDELTARGVNAELAERLARWSLAHAALPIVRVARRHGGSIPRCARVYFQLSERLGIERARCAVRSICRAPAIGRSWPGRRCARS